MMMLIFAPVVPNVRADGSVTEIKELFSGNREVKIEVHPPHGSGNCCS